MSIPETFHYKEWRANQTEFVDFLRSNGLVHGYSTYWNAGNNTVLSNFDVEIGGLIMTDPLQPYYWLSSDTTYDPDAYEGESFLLFTEEEEENYRNSNAILRLGKPVRKLRHDGYVIYAYSYNIAMNDFMGERPFEYIERMYCSDPRMLNKDGSISVGPGQVIYGPYLNLEEGTYEIQLELSKLDGEAIVRLTSDVGTKTITTKSVDEPTITVKYHAYTQIEMFEVNITSEKSATLNSIIIKKVD